MIIETGVYQLLPGGVMRVLTELLVEPRERVLVTLDAEQVERVHVRTVLLHERLHVTLERRIAAVPAAQYFELV